MIKLIFNTLKFVVIASVILVIGQIPVGERRICDHVFDVTNSKWVQKPIHWIADRFVFIDHKYVHGISKINRNEGKNPRAADSEPIQDRSRLSGLFKH